MSRTDEAVASHDTLIARARALAPIFKERAAACENQRSISDETAADIAASGLVRISQPKRFGGYEHGRETMCESTMELARGDASQAWVANIYAEHAHWVGMFPQAAQQDVWGKDPDTFVGSSISQIGQQVERVDGGCVLTGKWAYVSGVRHAKWVVIGELVPEPDGPPRYHYLLIPATDYTIIDDWHTVGLAGTGSMTIATNRAFVPAHRMLLNTDVVAGTTPGASVNDNPIYRMPIFNFSGISLAALPVGIAETAIGDFAKYIEQRVENRRGPSLIPSLLSRIAESAAEAKVARLLVLDAARANTAKLRSGASLDHEDAARTHLAGAYSAVLCRRAVSRMFEASGAQGIRLGQLIERAFRDVQATAVHAGLNWDMAAAKYGKLLTGQPPDPSPF